MNARSLRFRLALWHAALLTAVFVLLGGLLFSRLKNFLEANVLETQARRARQISETLLANLGPAGESRLGAEIKSLYYPELSGRFIRVAREDGALIYVSGAPLDKSFDPAAVPATNLPARREFAWKQDLPGGGALLIAAARAAAVDRRGSYLVEVGESAQPIEAMLHRLLVLLAAGLPVVLGVAAAGGYFLVTRALKPVEEIAGRAELLTHHNLGERVPVPRTGDELERLAVSLNRMITRLEDAFQNSSRFVADASHELRTPLTVLRGELEHLIQDPKLDAGHADRLGSLFEEVERLGKIVERLLALSRLDAGEAQKEWVALDLGDLVVGTADQMTLLAKDRKISLTRSAAPGLRIMGDRVRLKEVVVNLLDNAIKYTPVGGAITLKVFAAGRCAWLEVTDTGVGIPAEALPHVFERFYRVDPARSRDPEGVGLGLAIVKSICLAHGGTVEVESRPGHGSRFKVGLPLPPGPAENSESQNGNEPSS